MKRLFVFGCSFTNWVWPTWADLLSLEFEHYENWASPGLGNRAIAEKVAESHTRNKFTETDTVIIQWSSHTRYDWYKNVIHESDNLVEGWKINHDSKYYNKYRILFEKIYSEKGFVLHTLNMMVLIKGLLLSTGCEWYMTSLSDIRNLGYDSLFQNRYSVDEHQQAEKIIKENIKSSNYILYDRFPEFMIYDEILWKSEIKWLSPMFKNLKENKDLLWTFSKDNYIEFHPTPEQHHIWLRKNLSFMLKAENNHKRDNLIDAFRKLKERTNLTSDSFRDLSEDLFVKISDSKFKILKEKQLGF